MTWQKKFEKFRDGLRETSYLPENFEFSFHKNQVEAFDEYEKFLREKCIINIGGRHVSGDGTDEFPFYYVSCRAHTRCFFWRDPTFKPEQPERGEDSDYQDFLRNETILREDQTRSEANPNLGVVSVKPG